MAKKLFVRFSTSKDEPAIFDFYNQNKHQFVFQRDPAVWKERIASGAVTIVHDDQGNIVASGICYPVFKKQPGGSETHEWTELGSTRVTLDGIGLAKIMTSAQVLRAYLLEPPDDRFVMEIVIGNNHSKHVYTKMGAVLFDASPEFLEKVTATIVPGSETQPVEWFQFGAELMPEFARSLLESQKNPIVRNKATGEEYELDYSQCLLVTLFDSEVKDLALKNFGDAKKPDPKRRLNSCKPKFNP